MLRLVNNSFYVIKMKEIMMKYPFRYMKYQIFT